MRYRRLTPIGYAACRCGFRAVGIGRAVSEELFHRKADFSPWTGSIRVEQAKRMPQNGEKMLRYKKEETRC